MSILLGLAAALAFILMGMAGIPFGYCALTILGLIAMSALTVERDP